MPNESRSRTAGQVDADPGGDALAEVLLGASRVLVAVAARSLGATEGVVTLTQFRTLVVLEGEGLSLGGLAGRLEVNASTAQRMVERLVRAELVSRSVDPDDRRAVILRLTAAGAALVAEVTRRRREEIAAIVQRMPSSARLDAVAALQAFADAAGEPPPPGDTAWTRLL